MRNSGTTDALAFVTLIGLCIIIFTTVSKMAIAEPEGGTVQYISNSTKNSTPPTGRTDAKGTITTLLISTVQQNIKWKAYVGNVSGTLVLRDSESYSIYEWPSNAGTVNGRVFLTRNSTIDWSTIQCANYTQIYTEEAVLGFVNSSVDNINNTFAPRIHKAFDVGIVPIIASSCKSTVTRVNNTLQTQTQNSLYQEVLLMDATSRLVYATIIDPDTRGYNNRSLYDFQAIVPDYVGASVATYYFYVEISG